MDYEEAVTYLLDIPRFTTKNGLKHTEMLWERLGRPGEAIPAVHVAGTNGKGSVCAFLASILEKSGAKTGLFTSPHLIDINERFLVGGVPVDDKKFLEAFQEVLSAVGAMEREKISHPTFFEFLFAMAMVLFEREKVDCVILETGLGGRLDATNILKKPAVTVITSIGLDHTEYLGETIQEIAGEKAGILKPGVPVVYDAKNPAVNRVIEERARRLQCQLLPVYPEDAKITKKRKKSIDFSYDTRYDKYIKLSMPQYALFQVENAMLALRAAECFLPEKSLYPYAAAEGIASMRWEARMEEVEEGVFLDGAHNGDGIAAFVSTAAQIGAGKKKVLLFSAVGDKNYESMAMGLMEIPFDAVIVTTLENKRGVPAQELAEVFGRYADVKITVENPVMRAYERGREEKGPDGVLFIVGSLYLAGEIKAGIGGSRREK